MSGVCGVVNETDCFSDLFFLADYHAHLGTKYGGMAVLGRKGITNKKIHNIGQGGFKKRFKPHAQELSGRYGIATISSLDKQPLAFRSKLGRLSVCTTGQVNNLEEIAQELERQGFSFTESSVVDRGTSKERLVRNTTEVISKLMIGQGDLNEGVQKVYDTINGSLSMVMVGDRGVYAVRDSHGRTPLFVGKRGRTLAVSMESFPLHNLGFDTMRMLKPGELIRISEAGIKTKLPGDESQTRFCAFYFIYTGFPASDYYDENVQNVRIKNGKLLGEGEQQTLDIISGMPDSGKFHGIGMAEKLGIPFREPLMKFTYSWGGRSFTPNTQEERDRYGKMKIVPVPSLIKRKRICVVDDSLVRGTQLAQTVDTKLWPYEPKEVHARIACPPLMFGCRYLQSTRTNELATRKVLRKMFGEEPKDISPFLNPKSTEFKDMIETMRKNSNFTSLRYQTMEKMMQAIGLPKEKSCTYCWDGQG
jgi:amidophosphoribosyltransferase